ARARAASGCVRSDHAERRGRNTRPSALCCQADDGIRDSSVTGVQTCALPIFLNEVQKVRRHRGVRRVPSLCLSQYGSAERLSEYQKLSLKLNTCLPASAACERLLSCAGLLFNAKLARMNSTHLENQLMLKLNKNFVD